MHYYDYMLMALLIWIYGAAIIAIFQWPDILSMIITFLVLGTIPLGLLIVIITRGKNVNSIRQRQRERRDADKASLMQSRVSEVDDQHSGDD